MLTAENRANLEKLAAYLEALPKDYGHFGMARWVDGVADKKKLARYALNNGGVTSCGTVACAVGHGPAAGVLIPEQFVTQLPEYVGVSWWSYARLFHGDSSRDFDWLFSANWSKVDDHHFGAAARIRYLLDRDTPPDGFRGEMDIRPSTLAEYAPYRIDAEAKADA